MEKIWACICIDTIIWNYTLISLHRDRWSHYLDQTGPKLIPIKQAWHLLLFASPTFYTCLDTGLGGVHQHNNVNALYGLFCFPRYINVIFKLLHWVCLTNRIIGEWRWYYVVISKRTTNDFHSTPSFLLFTWDDHKNATYHFLLALQSLKGKESDRQYNISIQLIGPQIIQLF